MDDSKMRGSPSLMLDARASIEHQLDIHVNDLAEWAADRPFKPIEILEGLRYLMEHRIKNGRLPNIDYNLANRLLQVLLMYIKKREKQRFMESKPTPESILALELLGQFLIEVHEFREATGRITQSVLHHSLNSGYWTGSNIPQNVRELAAVVISLLLDTLKAYGISYEEGINEEDMPKVQKLLDEFSNTIKKSKIEFTLEPGKVLYPIPRLYNERNALKVVYSFGSDPERGLNDDQIEELRGVYGRNKLDPPPKTPFYVMLFNQLKDLMVIILILMSLVELTTGSYDSGIVLMIVILFNTTVGFYLEYVASKAMSALFDVSVPQSKVIRNGGIVSTINSEELVPGDIISLEEGDSVPADLRIIECYQLKVNEAFLTGENIPVSKHSRSVTGRHLQIPINKCKSSLFMSTTITNGRCKGVVVRIGHETEIGSIGTVLHIKVDKKSRLQKELKLLGIYLVIGALVLCAINAIILISYRKPVLNSIKVSVTLAVSVIPEGLVAIVTGTMFIAMRRMAKKNAIIKNIHLIETLGSVTTICTDKTGTLTRGIMTLSSVYTVDNIFYNLEPYYGDKSSILTHNNTPVHYIKPDFDAISSVNNHDPDLSVDVNKSEVLDTNNLPSALKILIKCALLCNNANLSFGGSGNDKASHTGDPTEIALLTGSLVLGVNRESLFKHAAYELLTEFSFDSDRKLMSVVYSIRFGPGSEDLHYYVFTKGATENVFSKCNECIDTTNKSDHVEPLTTFDTRKITPELVHAFNKFSISIANEGNRVLALAFKKVDKNELKKILDSEDASVAESDLVLLGFVGLKDAPRPEAKRSVDRCEKAGIRVIVITGDHAATAISVARQLGIYDPNVKSKSVFMKGSNLSVISGERMREFPIFPVLFARTSPSDKLKIIKTLQSLREVVSMIGDGVNDAPSVKMANVGVSMALTGTEITKQAADMVLSDDNIETVVSAIEEGRRVYDNINKFLAYLISCNAAEIILFLITSILNYEAPFLTIQILWANIIADIPPAMSIGVEPTEEGLMERPPRPSSAKLISSKMALLMTIQSLIIAIPSFLIYAYTNEFGISDHQSLEKRRTLSFVCLMTLQMSQSFLSRSVFESVFKIGILGNKFLLWSFVMSMGLMIMGVYVPGIKDWLKFVPFHFNFWYIILGFVVFQIFTVELVKFIFKRVQTRAKTPLSKLAYD